MEVKQHRVVKLLPLEVEELPPSLLAKVPEIHKVSCNPEFLIGALIAVS